MKKIRTKYRELLRYFFAGGCTTLISIGVFHLCKLTMTWEISNFISWITAVTFAYFTNKLFVFQCASSFHWKEMLSFYTMRLFSLAIDMFSMFLLIQLCKMNDTLAKLLVQFIIVVINYVLSKMLIFRKKKGETSYEQNQCNRALLQ